VHDFELDEKKNPRWKLNGLMIQMQLHSTL